MKGSFEFRHLRQDLRQDLQELDQELQDLQELDQADENDQWIWRGLEKSWSHLDWLLTENSKADPLPNTSSAGAQENPDDEVEAHAAQWILEFRNLKKLNIYNVTSDGDIFYFCPFKIFARGTRD